MQLKAIGKCRNLQLEKNVKANLPNHQWQPYSPTNNNTFNVELLGIMVKAPKQSKER